jgi:hypothetical protein
MESKDIFLVVGLVVILGVVVTLSTMTITGNVTKRYSDGGTYTDTAGLAEVTDVDRVVSLSHNDFLATLADAKVVSKTVSTTATLSSQSMKCSELCTKQGSRESRNKCLLGLFSSKHELDDFSDALTGTVIVSCDKQVKVVSGDILSCYCGR